MATVTVSGTPQSDTATSSGSVSNPLPVFGKYDKTNTIAPETFAYNVATENFGCIVRSESVGCSVQPEQFGCVVDPCEPPPSGSGYVVPFITASGSPQAETATSSGSVSVLQNITVSGSPQAETATGSGSVLSNQNITVAGTPQAETATSSGSVDASQNITVSGTPQAETATSSGDATAGLCPPAHTPSSSVSWIAGAGSPTIDGSVWRANVSDAAVNDPTASTINTVLSSSSKLYAEFSICNFVTPYHDLFVFGWKRSDQLANLNQAFTAGIWWYHTGSEWRYNNNLNSTAGITFDVSPPTPARGQAFGVALDCSADKFYLIYDGTWLTTGGGASGGAPADGNGWDILNPDNEVVLYSCCQSDNAILQADDPKYTPSGYTEVT